MTAAEQGGFTEERVQLLEHALYHALIGRLECALSLEPCEAIKLSNELTAGIMPGVLKYADELILEAQNERNADSN